MSRRADARIAAKGQRLGSPMNIYWYYDRATARWVGFCGLLIALVTIPVGMGFGVPPGAATAIGAALALAIAVVTLTWRRSWSPPAAAAAVVGLAWPALLRPAWLIFSAVMAVALLAVAWGMRRMRTAQLRLENIWRAEEGKPPYVMSQEAIAEAYRAARR